MSQNINPLPSRRFERSPTGHQDAYRSPHTLPPHPPIPVYAQPRARSTQVEPLIIRIASTAPVQHPIPRIVYTVRTTPPRQSPPIVIRLSSTRTSMPAPQIVRLGFAPTERRGPQGPTVVRIAGPPSIVPSPVVSTPTIIRINTTILRQQLLEEMRHRSEPTPIPPPPTAIPNNTSTSDTTPSERIDTGTRNIPHGRQGSFDEFDSMILPPTRICRATIVRIPSRVSRENSDAPTGQNVL